MIFRDICKLATAHEVTEIHIGISKSTYHNMSSSFSGPATESQYLTMLIEHWDGLLEQAKAQISEALTMESDDSDSDGNDSNENIDDDHDLEAHLKAHIDMLLDLVPSLESTIEHQEKVRYNQLKCIGGSFYASGPAHTYISLVHDKFPRAAHKLKERLGEANWQRHQNIRRRIDKIADPTNQ